VFVAGGIGLPPLRGLIWNVLDRRESFGKVTILYGARTPSDLVYKQELQEWGRARTWSCASPWTAARRLDRHRGHGAVLFEQVDLKPQTSLATSAVRPS